MKIDLDEWRELASPFYEVYPNEPPETAGVDIAVSESANLFFSQIITPAQMLVHDPVTRRQVDHDYLLFERFYSGGGKGEVGDTGFIASPERLHLIDMSQRYVSQKNRSASRGVCIPHEALGYVPGEQPAFFSVELDTPRGRLLAAAHAELVQAQEKASVEEVEILASTFIILVRQLMLGQNPDENSSLSQELPLALLLRNYISANLSRPDLDAKTLAADFGVSRATLYRQFENEGGISRFIRDRRLDRCFFELAGSSRVRGQVTKVARRWNFTDASRFNRLFRQRFGKSPSESLAPAEPFSGAVAPPEQAMIIKTWMKQFQRL